MTGALDLLGHVDRISADLAQRRAEALALGKDGAHMVTCIDAAVAALSMGHDRMTGADDGVAASNYAILRGDAE